MSPDPVEPQGLPGKALRDDSLDRVMVVGATGLVGSHLVSALQEDYIVHSVSSTSAGAAGLAVKHHAVDLASAWSPDELPDEVEAVVYLAQSSRFRDLSEQALHVFSVNTASVVAMMDYAHRAGARKFIFASSGGVYPDRSEPLSEQMLVTPAGIRDFYSATKLSSEILLEAAAGQIDLTILRIFFAYGRSQGEDMLIPRLVSRVREGVPVTLRGQEGFRLNPIHVSDVVRAIEASLSLPGTHTINLAGPQIHTLREVAFIIGEHLGRQPLFEFEEEGSGPESLVGDITKMSRLLAPPERTFVEGVMDLL